MGDVVKIAVKTALIAVVTAAVIALFATIQVPALDYSVFKNALSVGLAVLFHWFPIMNVLWPVVLALLALDLAIIGFNTAMIAVRWIFKVNE